MRNKAKLQLLAAMFVLCSMAAFSCTHSAQQKLTVSFSKDVIPIFSSYCAINSNCHAGTSSYNHYIDLDSAMAYETIITKNLVSTANPLSSILYTQIAGNGIAFMPKPPAAALSLAQQNLILNWIEQGALNN
jgi:hypothetical protein